MKLEGSESIFRRLLVPLDGSHPAEELPAYVRDLARGLQSRVELLQVLEPLSPTLDVPSQAPKARETESGVHRRVRSYLDDVAERLSGEGLEVSTKVVVANPAFQIITLGEQETGTLVVMHTHGGYSAERWSVESVTAKVLHGTIAPVLVIPATSDATSSREEKLSTVIVCLDGSSVAEQVLPYAVALARPMALSVTLLMVVRTPDEADAYTGEARPVTQDLDQRTDGLFAEYLAVVGEKLRADGLGSVEERVMHGDPADAILNAASEAPDSLVAMATHGRSEVARLIIGSVSDQVVQRATGPVLVVHATVA